MNEELFLTIVFIGLLVCLFLYNLYIYKNCSVKVTARVIGSSKYGRNPYSSNEKMMVLEYTYNNSEYKKTTCINIKDIQRGSIVDIYVNPKKPTMIYHKSINRAFIKLGLFICVLLVFFIIKMIKK